jgi:KipI family sensor histidine kinase inhibitor
MQIRPSGTRGLLLELDSLEEVLELYAALQHQPPAGVVDLVPAARTILVMVAEDTALGDVAAAVRATTPRAGGRNDAPRVELPVHYHGEDLSDVAELLGCTTAEVVQRHCNEAWTVAFCGFAPGFGYLTAESGHWDLPRRPSPRTRVPAGAVALAGEFSGVYPRDSPGGWQLIGHTEVAVFDLHRDPTALLTPGARVRFVDADR